MKPLPWLMIAAIAVPVLAGCHGATTNADPSPLQLESGAFSSATTIPPRFTCDGADVSPALSWSTPPSGTKSFALIVYDSDTPQSFTHWQIYNLPGSARALPESIPAQTELPDGARQTSNSFDHVGYGGPCPPIHGTAHRYVFDLYALDTSLNLPPDADQQQLRLAMVGHILAKGRMISTYKRSPQAPAANVDKKP